MKTELNKFFERARKFVSQSNSEQNNQQARLQTIKEYLMIAGTWRFLRYIHLREAVVRVQSDVETIGVVGTGAGMAELALAVEFPHIHFTLSDIIDENYPRFHNAMNLSWRWGVDNVDFAVWDILEPTSRRFDCVCSTEVLEHIQNDDLAANRMREAALKYVYCLVPFAAKAQNEDKIARARVLKSHGHHVFGYDAQRLEALFPNPAYIAGAYFDNAGQLLRAQLDALDRDEIKLQLKRLVSLAKSDLQDRIPSLHSEAQGIKILSQM